MSENRIIRELSQNELREIRNLATGMCANYSDYYKECVLLDRPCYMFNVRYAGSGMCKYFRSAVLPLNPALEAALNNTDSTKECSVCGTAFVPFGRSLFCSDKCRVYAKRIQNRNSQKKYRNKSE